jgi:hypothetical protein
LSGIIEVFDHLNGHDRVKAVRPVRQLTNIAHGGFDIGLVGAPSTGDSNLVRTDIYAADAPA